MVETNAITLEGAFNVRDLGGHEALDGRRIRQGVLVRADGTHHLTGNDIKVLMDRGLTLVIDLRSREEIKGRQSMLCERADIRYENISMLDDFFSSDDSWSKGESMSGLYISMLKEYGPQYKEIIRLILKTKGMTLFHCSMGKDRTGVLAMLLLGLAGVPDETILSDYAVSAVNLMPITVKRKKKLRDNNEHIPEFYFESDPVQMRKTIDFLRRAYGGIREYLSDCGLSDSELEELRRRMF